MNGSDSHLSEFNKPKVFNVIKATYTLSFQNQKLAFLMAENESSIPVKSFCWIFSFQKNLRKKSPRTLNWLTRNIIEQIYVPSNPFANKGNYGYACLLSGSYGMMGAAVLSSRACLRSGVGKLTCLHLQIRI